MDAVFNQIDPVKYIKILHRNTDGYVTFMRKSSTRGKVSQLHVKLEEITDELVRTFVAKDTYLSLNSFYRRLRRNNQLRTLHNFYVDLDCYNMGLTPEQVLYSLYKDYFNSKLPMPNIILYTGRGLALIWQAEAISGLALKRWGKVQRSIYTLLKELGADPSCATDGARVFRLPASINSKSNEIVRYDHLHDRQIDIKTFASYFPEANSPKETVMKCSRLPKRKIGVSKKKNMPRKFSQATLLANRLNDLAKLIELRNGDMKGYRERLLFIVRHYTYLLTGDNSKAVQKILEMNGLFSMPLNTHEVVNATKSAVEYVEHEKHLHFYNDTLISWFDITAEEQLSMSTIISKDEKKRRNRLAKEKARRRAGATTKGEYNRRRALKLKRLLAKLKLILATYPNYTLTAISKRLGVSKSYMTKLMTKLNKQEINTTDNNTVVSKSTNLSRINLSLKLTVAINKTTTKDICHIHNPNSINSIPIANLLSNPSFLSQIRMLRHH